MCLALNLKLLEMEKNKILLIGGNGYIGCRLYDYLKPNYDITNLDVCWFGKIYEETIKMNYDDLKKEYLSQFSHVILLAGHSSVSMCDSLQTPFRNNVMNFINLIEKLDDEQILIYSSTAAVYGSNPNLVDETSSLDKSINFYDYTKLCNESIMELYPNKKIVGLRFGSVGGFSKNFRKENLMNSISLSAHYDKKIKISNPDNYRSVLGITDLCGAIEKILMMGYKKRIYNLTSINDRIINFGKKLQELVGCELMIDDSLKTSYSFNCSNNLFQTDYEYTFTDTIESIYNEIIDSLDEIIVNQKRKSI